MTYADHLSAAWKEYASFYRLLAALVIPISPIIAVIVWAVSNFAWRQSIAFGECLLIAAAVFVAESAFLIAASLPMVFVEALIRTCDRSVDEH